MLNATKVTGCDVQEKTQILSTLWSHIPKIATVLYISSIPQSDMDSPAQRQ